MSVLSSRCPVPPEQLPINQYQDMDESWFYRLGKCTRWSYYKPLFVLWCVSWVVAGPVAASSYAPAKALIPFVIWATIGALVGPLLVLLQIYVGWSHVGQRLRLQELPYEESGWYDGQVWVKPEEVLNRDRLILTYEVQPVLHRVRNTVGILLALGAGLVTIWQFL